MFDMQKPIGPLSVPFNSPLPIAVQEFGRGKPVLSIVSGLHGDEYNGLYVCHLLIEWLRRVESRQGDHVLRGKVRVLPAINPVGLLLAERNWPFDDTDIDRMFPGYAQGETVQRLASWVFDRVRHSDACVDIHASDRFIEEWPQAVVYSGQNRALKLAMAMALPLVCLHRPGPHSPGAMDSNLLHSTLSYNLLQVGVDSVVVQAGRGLHLEPTHCERVFAGLVRLALHLGVVSGPAPVDATATQVMAGPDFQLVHSRCPGLFLPLVTTGEIVRTGQLLGRVLDPLRGEMLEQPISPCNGWVVSLRLHPVVLQGSLIARICPDDVC